VLIKFFSLGVTVEALRAKIDQKSAISLQRGHFDLKFQIEGDVPTNNSPSKKTKINVADFFKRSAILEEKRPICVFETPFGGVKRNVR